MKNKSSLLPILRGLGTAAALALAALPLAADTLKTDTVVFAQTDPKSPVLARLKAGAKVEVVGEAPAGWRRVEVAGPFEAFVHNSDITKGLEVREGASVRAAPRKDAQILTTAAAEDKSEVIGLVAGDWCQIKLQKTLQGFIAVGATANQSPSSRPAPVASAPVAPAPKAGHAVPVTAGTADMPRLFAGRLVLAKRLLANPNPPYDYQLSDANGRRFAYVDTRRLLLTEKIEAYLDRNVAINGTVRNTVDGKDLVIAAESMQLK